LTRKYSMKAWPRSKTPLMAAFRSDKSGAAAIRLLEQTETMRLRPWCPAFRLA
jgi:hypothetical protein